MHLVKSDIINGTLKSDEKYNNWINKYLYEIVHQLFDESYHYHVKCHVKCHPQKYLKHMIFMNTKLEKINEDVSILSSTIINYSKSLTN